MKSSALVSFPNLRSYQKEAWKTHPTLSSTFLDIAAANGRTTFSETFALQVIAQESPFVRGVKGLRKPQAHTNTSKRILNNLGASLSATWVSRQIAPELFAESSTKQLSQQLSMMLLVRGTPILEKKLRECMGKMKIYHVGSHQFGNRSGSCSENCGFRVAQVVRCHSENGISHSEKHFLNSESRSENTPELSANVFPDIGLKLGWSPGF